MESPMRSDACMTFSIRHVSDVQDLGAECILVELKGLLCVAHDQVWGKGMKSWGNSFHVLGHRNLLRRGILDYAEVKICQKFVLRPRLIRGRDLGFPPPWLPDRVAGEARPLAHAKGGRSRSAWAPSSVSSDRGKRE